jgi:hypothetical protein
MVRLDRVVHDSEAPALAGLAQRALELAHEAHRAQRRDILPDLQRQVTRMPRRKRSSLPMRVLRARGALAARTFAGDRPSGAQREDRVEAGALSVTYENHDTIK